MAEKSQHTIPASTTGTGTPVEEVTRRRPQVYQDELAFQEQLFFQNIHAKEQGLPTQNTLIITEHEPVYTLGKSGKEDNMLFKPESVGATLYRTNRGGDITFHGPGQMVVYPIFDLETMHIGLAGFVHALEDTVIATVAHYGILASRLEGAPGIWVGVGTDPRKICAIGLKASRHCTMHGIALNVNTDLRFFDYIVPCGISGKGVTSIQKELNREVSMEEVQSQFTKELAKQLGLDIR